MQLLHGIERSSVIVPSTNWVNESGFDCGILLTKEVLGGKWKSALLYTIAMGIQRPSAIQRQIPDASRRVLNVQFNELAQHGLIGKTIYAQLPPKIEYYLTDFGRSLLRCLSLML